MKQFLKKSYSLLSIFLPALSLGCGDSTSPAADMAVGNYTAVEFVTTGNSGQKNELVVGGSLVLSLNANGTTSGHLHMVAPGGGPDFDADMAGTWTRTGMIVDIDQPADTFVRDMPFTLTPGPADGWDLVGNQTFSGTNIRLRLSPT